MGNVEDSTRRFIKAMGDLAGPEEPLTEVALTLARAIDGVKEDTRQLSNLTKELRLVLKQLEGGSGGEDDGWGDLASPE